MAIRKVVYSKNFKGDKETDGYRLYHVKIMENILGKYSGYRHCDEWETKDFGFDGEIQYIFDIDDCLKIVDEDYDLTINITKMGNEEIIKNALCDLEKFLLANDFKELK